MPLVARGLVTIAPDAECSRKILAGAWHIPKSCLLHEALAVLCSMTAVQGHFSMDSLASQAPPEAIAEAHAVLDALCRVQCELLECTWSHGSNGWFVSEKTCSLRGFHLHGGGNPQDRAGWRAAVECLLQRT